MGVLVDLLGYREIQWGVCVIGAIMVIGPIRGIVASLRWGEHRTRTGRRVL
jgi:hypothetical protein